MRLVDVRAEHDGGRMRFVGTIEKLRPPGAVDVYFEFRGTETEASAPPADAFVAAMLLPAMRAGEPLEIAPPISPRLHFNLPRIRDLFHTWYPNFAPVEIRTTAEPAAATARKAGAATFFSGGVDSFYTLLKYTRGPKAESMPLTHAVFMHGVETRLERSKGVDESARWVARVAERAGVRCLTGQTNLRSDLQGPADYIHWERHYHGSALAAIGLALSPPMGVVCIPSAFSYNHLVAHGSSPLLDEMYSTDATYILHDGSEVTRAMKVARMIEWDRDLVLDHLRVCIHNSGGAYNCGRCYKCVRTAIPLMVLGVWEQARTFPDKSTSHWEAVVDKDHLALTEENLAFAREHGGSPDLVAMLERVVRRRRRGAGARMLVENSALASLAPALSRLRGRPAPA